LAEPVAPKRVLSLYCYQQVITMRLTNILQRVVRLGRNSGETSTQTSSGRAAEQRDDSSMAEFVRILRDHDSRQAN
jgi:hypothetical protein